MHDMSACTNKIFFKTGKFTFLLEHLDSSTWNCLSFFSHNGRWQHPQEYSIPTSANSQWHFLMQSTRTPIFIPVNWSSDSSSFKSLQSPIRYFKVVFGSKTPNASFYFPPCIGFYYFNWSILSPKALAIINPTVFPATIVEFLISFIHKVVFVFLLFFFAGIQEFQLQTHPPHSVFSSALWIILPSTFNCDVVLLSLFHIAIMGQHPYLGIPYTAHLLG